MASAPPNPLASSEKTTNGAKLNRILIDGGTTVLRLVFDSYHSPANLAADLNSHYSKLCGLFKKGILHGQQWDKLFPGGGAGPDSSTFDITLFLLLIEICGLKPPPTSWHRKPPQSDTSYEANLARIKFFRNQLYGHVTATGVDTPMFNTLWQEISSVLVSLGLSQAEIDRLKAERCGEKDYLDALRQWAENERDLKTQLNDMRQSVEDKIEDVHQIVSEIRETQLSIDEEQKILQKLAKIDTQLDVIGYAKRYLEGTRESVFARINTWLDDASSPNRVFVISGNAVRKSVIAAEICRRKR